MNNHNINIETTAPAGWWELFIFSYIAFTRKSQSGQQFDLINTKLTANPDFMARLAPQWPEPEPADPGEGQAFIVQQVGRAHAGSHSTVSTQQIYYL